MRKTKTVTLYRSTTFSPFRTRNGQPVICRHDELYRYYRLPRNLRKLIVVFSIDKPKHGQARGLVEQLQHEIYEWRVRPVGVTSTFFVHAHEIMRKRYDEGYRWVHLEYEA